MFSDNLKTLRLLYGYTQREVAAAVGISRRSLQSYESGAAFPRNRETLNALASFFNVATATLLGQEEPHLDKELNVYSRDPSVRLRMLLAEMSILFTSGNLTEEDRDLVMKTMNDLYWESKGMPGKSRRGSADNNWKEPPSFLEEP